MALLKGNKRNKLDTWSFKRKNNGKVSSVKVKENPSYRVTITYINGNDILKSSTKKFHSSRAVNKIYVKPDLKIQHTLRKVCIIQMIDS